VVNPTDDDDSGSDSVETLGKSDGGFCPRCRGSIQPRGIRGDGGEWGAGGTKGVVGAFIEIVPIRAMRVLRTVLRTGRAPRGYQGGRVFRNDGRPGDERLPTRDSTGQRITYREYDINPRQAGVNRGSERIVVGSNGRAYYMSDHYRTFTPIDPRTGR